MSQPIIEVKHLSKTFGSHEVLRDVNFNVHEGDVTCVIGASGSGKSTLLRCINLLEHPTSGEILFHGAPIVGKGTDPCRYRSKVGMVFQSFNLFNNMTVLENCMTGPIKVLKRSADAVSYTHLEAGQQVRRDRRVRQAPALPGRGLQPREPHKAGQRVRGL